MPGIHRGSDNFDSADPVPFVGARLGSGSAASLTSSLTTYGTLPLGAAVEDTDNFTSVANRITIPSGNWKITMQVKVNFSANSTGSRRIRLKINGAVMTNSTLVDQTACVGGVGTNMITGLVAYPCSGGDYFEVTAAQSSGAALNAAAQSLTLTLVKA